MKNSKKKSKSLNKINKKWFYLLLGRNIITSDNIRGFKMAILISIGKVAEKYGVTTQTIRNWTKQGKFKNKRTFGNHRRYLEKEIKKDLGEVEEEKITVTYARVSSNDQKEDLKRQSEELKKYCEKEKIEKIEEIKEIGSGINYKKRGLKKLIRWIIEGKVKRIVLGYKDRLLRFGIEILEQICELKEVEIKVVKKKRVLRKNWQTMY